MIDRANFKEHLEPEGRSHCCGCDAELGHIFCSTECESEYGWAMQELALKRRKTDEPSI